MEAQITPNAEINDNVTIPNDKMSWRQIKDKNGVSVASSIAVS